MTIVITNIKRTAIGKLMGMYKNYSAPEIGAIVLKSVVKNINVSDIDEVIMGNVLQAGVGQNPARQAAILSGIPNFVGAYTVNKVCGSGLKSIILACQSIESGDNSLVLAGGMENMSKAPHIYYGRKIRKLGDLKSIEIKGKYKLRDSLIQDGLWCAYNNCHMGELADKITKKYKISRQEQDEFALKSHQKALDAMSNGNFKKEIVGSKGFRLDEGPRCDSTIEGLSQLKGVFGSITAGNASTINDGAAAALICSLEKAKELKLDIIAQVESYSSSSINPKDFPIAPVSGVKALLRSTGRKISDYDLIELNEAFAGQAIAVVKDLGIDIEKLNVNGGAIALGHPIGASGARILCTLIHELKRRGGGLGLATLCIGGGESVSMSIKV